MQSFKTLQLFFHRWDWRTSDKLWSLTSRIDTYKYYIQFPHFTFQKLNLMWDVLLSEMWISYFLISQISKAVHSLKHLLRLCQACDAFKLNFHGLCTKGLFDARWSNPCTASNLQRAYKSLFRSLPNSSPFWRLVKDSYKELQDCCWHTLTTIKTVAAA